MTFSSDGNGGVRSIDPETGEEAVQNGTIASQSGTNSETDSGGGVAPHDAFKLVTINAAKTIAPEKQGEHSKEVRRGYLLFRLRISGAHCGLSWLEK